MKVLAAALLSICLSVAAQFLLKAGVMALKGVPSGPDGLARLLAWATNLPLLAGFGLYAAGAAVWLYVLAHWDVSKAYPLVGLGFVLTALFGTLVAGEQLSVLRWMGIALVCCGVVLIARS